MIDRASFDAATKRQMAAQLMCLAPHVCKAIYQDKPIPIGWIFHLAERPPHQA